MTVDRPVLRILLAIDGLLIAIYLALAALRLADAIPDIPHLFHIEKDWSFGEMFNYIKWAMLMGIFAVAFTRTRDKLMLALCGIAAILLLDDSLQLHEQGGRWIMSALGVERVARALAPNLAEIAIFASLGLAGLVGLGLAWRRSDPELRSRVLPMVWIMAGIALCGIVVDTVHFMVPGVIAAGILGVLEDGGEMIGASVLVAYAWSAYLRGTETAARPSSEKPAK